MSEKTEKKEEEERSRAGSSTALVTGEFTLGTDGNMRETKLTSEHISVLGCDKLKLNDVAGVEPRGRTLHVHWYPRNKKGNREYKPLVLGGTEESVAEWSRSITCLLENVPISDTMPPKRRILVLVNPMSGKKKGSEVWSTAETLLAHAHVDLNVIVTERADHGTEIVSDLDASTVDGIVTVSGDGLLYEVLQGIFKRDDASDFLTRVPLGIIAAGTANALATTLGALRPLDAAMHVAHRRYQALDLWDVQLGGERKIGFCIFTWGLLSAATKNAEGYRWMGGPRYKFAGVLEMFRSQKHRVTVDYVPAPDDAGFFKRDLSKDESSGATTYTSIADIPQKQVEPPVYEDAEWVTVEGDYEIVLGTNLTHISYDILSSPFAQYADGFMDMQLVKPQGFLSNVKLLGKIKTGSHLNPDIQYTKVRAIRVTPRDAGIPVNVDGEIYDAPANETIMVTVLPSAATIMFNP